MKNLTSSKKKIKVKEAVVNILLLAFTKFKETIKSVIEPLTGILTVHRKPESKNRTALKRKTVIEPVSGWQILNLKELLEYRDLLFSLV